MIFQRTLKQAISATGVGLHSGERVKLTPAGSTRYRIVFRRTDLPEPVDVKVEPALVNDTRLSSTLVTDTGVRVGTIEHLMSAFAGFGIDNLVVEVTAAEIPIMDGSAAPSFTCCKVQAWLNKPSPSASSG
jgi:UDP-3-O-[3-hydroxymyristoyl] N-acetylglucosamine deacetylase